MLLVSLQVRADGAVRQIQELGRDSAHGLPRSLSKRRSVPGGRFLVGKQKVRCAGNASAYACRTRGLEGRYLCLLAVGARHFANPTRKGRRAEMEANITLQNDIRIPIGTPSLN